MQAVVPRRTLARMAATSPQRTVCAEPSAPLNASPLPLPRSAPAPLSEHALRSGRWRAAIVRMLKRAARA